MNETAQKPHTLKRILLRGLTTTVLLIVVTLLPLQLAFTQEKVDEPFILNLKNVDIRSLIETVSQRTGKNFIVDPRVKATVNLISSNPIGSEKLYEIFLSVLEVHGYAAVTAGQMIKIVPTTVGAQSAIPVLSADAVTGDELASQVVPLTNTPAAQMVESLRPLLPESAIISAESNTNSIVITDRAANIEKLILLIESLDNP